MNQKTFTLLVVLGLISPGLLSISGGADPVSEREDLGASAGAHKVSGAGLPEWLTMFSAPQASLIFDPDRGTLLETGDALLTCGVLNAGDAVVALFEVRNPVTTVNSYDLNGGNYPIWSRPAELHPAMWSFSNLGSVFGTAVDRERNMYVTASSSFSPQLNLLSQANGTSANVNFQSGTGAIGRAATGGPNATAELNAAGTIYQLDAVSGAPSVFAVLPQQSTTADYDAFITFNGTDLNLSTGSRNNTGPGLGNIAYDVSNDQFFVSNFEDGKIYRIAANGTVQPDPFDYGIPDNGAAGMPALQDRVWGVGVYGGRLYYSVWTDLACTNGDCGDNISDNFYDNGPNPTIKPFIRSVALDPATGAFLPLTDQLEYNGADLEHTAPISDIAFDADGNMLIAQKTMLTDYAGYNHRSQVAYLVGGNGTWVADPFFTAPRENPTNANRYGTESYGGVDFGYDGTAPDAFVWYSSADMVRDANIANGSQGPHGVAGFMLTDLVGTNFPDPRAIVPYDGAVTSPNSTDLKGSGGDIEIVGDYVSLGNLVWEDSNDNGLFDLTESGIPGVTVNLLNAGGAVLMTTTTNSSGEYLFTDLLPGDYIVEIIPPAGYGTSTGSLLLLGAGPYEPASDPDVVPADDDDNGTVSGAAIRTAVITLEELGEPTGEPALNGLTDYVIDANANYTVDFGLISPCSIDITSLDVQCTNGTDFTVSFNVDYSMIASPASSSIQVTVAGTAQPAVIIAGASGTTSFGPITVAGPGYNLLIEATVMNDQGCTITIPFDLIACTDPCVDGDDLGGNVFNDFNNDGADAGATEVGQANVFVEIYECDSDVPVATTWTNADGDWSINDDAITYPVRVEFSTPLQDYLQPGFAGDDSGTNTQFVDMASCEVDYGVVNPDDYCQENPQFSVACYVIGDPAFHTTQEAVLEASFLSGTYTPSSTFGPIGPEGSGNAQPPVNESHIVNALTADIGTVRFIGYHRASNTILVASYMKRYAGFPSGPNDTALGTIYAIDRDNNPNVAVPLYVADAGEDVHDYSSPDFNAPTFGDTQARDLVGFAGWGDIEVDEENNLLYAINYHDNLIHVIPLVQSGSTISAGAATTIAYPAAVTSLCSGDEWRPGALKIRQGYLYSAVTCTALTSQDTADLHTYVVRIPTNTPAPVFERVIDFALDYPRQPFGTQSSEWRAWVNGVETPEAATSASSYYPMPHVTDIEFDDGGNMVIGISDRKADYSGTFNANAGFPASGSRTINGGDLVRAENISNGLYQVEDIVSGATVNPETEFFIGDGSSELLTPGAQPSGGHVETVFGALASQPGTNTILAPAIFGGNLGGVRFMDATTGDYLRYLSLFQTPITPTGGTGNGEFFGKAASLGDVEFLCQEVPIQIGNYVWLDDDEDGVQDACEEPVTGLPVTLYTQDDNGTLTQVDMTTT
ncbi:SdrD B-like domain-containing protein, partial [Neolewinella aurantiaca]